MLPVLEAEEMLAQIQVTAIPWMKEGPRERLLDRLQFVARGGVDGEPEEVERLDVTSEDGQQVLAGLGIGFSQEAATKAAVDSS